MRLNSHPSGRHFLQIPGPTNVPDRILRAMDYPTIDHRGPEFNALAKKVLRSVRQVFQTKQPVIVYPASGTGAWEAALVNTLSSGRPGADVGDRPLRLAVEEDGRQARHQVGVHGRRLAQAGRSRGDREAPEGRQGPRHQGGVHRPQRDLDRRGERHRRRAPRHRCGPPPCPAAGRHDLLAGLDRLSPRRLGRRRHGGGLAEGPDAAARPLLQRGQREGGRGVEELQDAQGVLELGGDAGGQRQRLVPLHARHQPDLRPQRGLRHAAGGRARRGVRAPCAPRRGDAHGRERLGARDPVQRSQGLFGLADGDRHARGPRRRRLPQGRAGELQPVARPGPVARSRARSSASAISATSTT